MKRNRDNSRESNAGIPWIHVAHLLGESARVMLETCRIWHSQLTRSVHPMLLWNRPLTITKFMKRFVLHADRLVDLPLDTREIHIFFYDDGGPSYTYDFSRFANLRVLHYVDDTVQEIDLLNATLDILHVHDPQFNETWLLEKFRGSVLCIDQWSSPSFDFSGLASVRVLVVLKVDSQIDDSFLPLNLTQLHVPNSSKLGPRGRSLWRSRDVVQQLYPDLFRTFAWK